MSDLSNVGSDIVEAVTDTVGKEVKAIGQAVKGQVLPGKKKIENNGQNLDQLKRKEKIRRQKLLDQRLEELRQLRKNTLVSAPFQKPLTKISDVPQLKRVEGWQTEVARHRQEVGVSKGKG